MNSIGCHRIRGKNPPDTNRPPDRKAGGPSLPPLSQAGLDQVGELSHRLRFEKISFVLIRRQNGLASYTGRCSSLNRSAVVVMRARVRIHLEDARVRIERALRSGTAP
jgi:hypothetical protein